MKMYKPQLSSCLCIITLVASLLMICTERVSACGGITHIEISFRALFNYRDKYNNKDYEKIARENQDALEAGSSYPDVFYPDVCFSGRFHDVSEDTHWTPFLNVTINYIKSRYPEPWNKSTQKLIAFLLGIVSHQVADMSWHSLGIPQGFLTTMGYTNYYGDYTTAHAAGDLGGDVLNLYQLDLSYSDALGEWYIPMDDLINIYQLYYGIPRIDYNTLETCSKLLYLSKVAERLIVAKYYPISARGSPFLVDSLYSYFLGGVTDMAAWTRRIWHHVTYALQHGTSTCNHNRNPLFLRCGTDIKELKKSSFSSGSLESAFYLKQNDTLFQRLNDIKVQKQGQGVVLKPSLKFKTDYEHLFKELKSKQSQAISSSDKKGNYVKDMSIRDKQNNFFTVSSKISYADLGRALAVGDLDLDGWDDLMVTSPGHVDAFGRQNGAVFVIFGGATGLNLSSSDVSKVADLVITQPDDRNLQGDASHGQFGWSAAVLGGGRLAVGAPSAGSADLEYTGAVYVFLITKDRLHHLVEAFSCHETYCNLGTTLTSLTSASATSDPKADLDLAVGSQYSPGGGEQRGTVTLVSARHALGAGNLVKKTVITDFETSFAGNKNYSWLGASMAFSNGWLAVGAPNSRNCALKNCSYSPADTQAAGQVLVYRMEKGMATLHTQINGASCFSMLGAAVAIGRPFGDSTDILAVSATAEGVMARVSGFSMSFPQVGSVYLYNLSSPNLEPLAVYRGDRKYGRFGATIKFADVNNDQIDDLIIGAPLRTHDVTGVVYGGQQGRLYIYQGGQSFRKGDVTAKCRFPALVNPCPESMASEVLDFNENLARFGSSAAVIKSRHKTQLIVTASHSSQGARLSGALAIYDWPHAA